MSSNSLIDWTELIDYQLGVAKRWYDRGNKIDDTFAKFFFYFSGFNALYFLWKNIDNVRDRDEKKHIKNLLSKFNRNKSIDIYDRIKERINYFIKRRPISRMNQRNFRDPNIGSRKEGQNYQRLLSEHNEPSDKIVAMGCILYLIRCNLVHGSKKDLGDDREIIDKSLEILKIYLEESITLTKKNLA